MKSRPGSRRSGAFSLLEITIAMAILIVLVATIYGVLSTAQTTYKNGTTLSELQENVRTTLSRISDDLRQANPATIMANGSSVSFQMCSGYSGGAVQWTPPTAVPPTPQTYIAYTVDTSDDGRNLPNGDSLRWRIFRYDPADPSTPSPGVAIMSCRPSAPDPNGALTFSTLLFSLAGPPYTAATVSLTLVDVDDRGILVSATGTVTVRFRNQ